MPTSAVQGHLARLRGANSSPTSSHIKFSESCFAKVNAPRSRQLCLAKSVYKGVLHQSIPSRIRQLILHHNLYEGYVDGFVRESTSAKRLHEHLLWNNNANASFMCVETSISCFLAAEMLHNCIILVWVESASGRFRCATRYLPMLLQKWCGCVLPPLSTVFRGEPRSLTPRASPGPGVFVSLFGLTNFMSNYFNLKRSIQRKLLHECCNVTF